MMNHRFFPLLLSLLLAGTAINEAPSCLFAEEIPVTASPDQKFLEELLNHGLFRLAEIHCRERLGTKNLPQSVRAELTLELIRVLQERSLCVPAPEQKELDEQAQNLYNDFRKANPDCPWELAVDFQYALGIFAHARREEMEARFALEAEKRLEVAREILREAIRRFLEIDEQREVLTRELAQDSQKSKPKPGKSIPKQAEVREYSRFSGDGLSLFELESLKSNVQFQLLLAYELQALCYPEESLDRLNALKEAQARARNLMMVPSTSRLYWNTRLAELRCFRLQNDFEGTRSRLDSLLKQVDSMPESVRLELLAERIRLALAEGKTDAALEVVKNDLHAKIIGQNGELDCAILELWLAQWSAAMRENAESETTRKLQQESVGILEEIRKKSTPWWVHRAEILFHGMFKNSGETQNISFLKMAAENACTNLDPDSESSCERLWEAACATKDEKMAFHAAELAGSFLYQSGKKEAAAKWFRRLSLTFSQNPEAGKNHLLAISVLAEALAVELNTAAGKLTTTLNSRLDEYQVLLLEHFQRFGTSDSPATVREILKKLQTVTKIRQNFAECVDVSMILVQNTPLNDANYIQTESECFGMWRLYLTQLRSASTTDYERALFTAVRWVETLTDLEKNNKLLEDSTRKTLAETRAKNCFFLLCALDQLSSEKGNQEKILQAETRLFTAMKPHLEVFPPEIRDEVEQIGTYAMIQAGNPQDAFPFYEKIALKFPNRLEVQLTWGRLLTEKALSEKDSTRLKSALEQWRKIEKHTENQTPDWYEAKYWVIRLQFELGETRQAKRLLRTFRTLHPDLGGEKWKAAFEKL